MKMLFQLTKPDLIFFIAVVVAIVLILVWYSFIITNIAIFLQIPLLQPKIPINNENSPDNSFCRAVFFVLIFY